MKIFPLEDPKDFTNQDQPQNAVEVDVDLRTQRCEIGCVLSFFAFIFILIIWSISDQNRPIITPEFQLDSISIQPFTFLGPKSTVWNFNFTITNPTDLEDVALKCDEARASLYYCDAFLAGNGVPPIDVPSNRAATTWHTTLVSQHDIGGLRGERAMYQSGCRGNGNGYYRVEMLATARAYSDDDHGDIIRTAWLKVSCGEIRFNSKSSSSQELLPSVGINVKKCRVDIHIKPPPDDNLSY